MCSLSALDVQVALLFLAREALPLEAVWTRWFALADNLVPWQSLDDVKANESSLERLSMLCSHSGNASAIDKQNLFSVYVHMPPCAPGMHPNPVRLSEASLKQRTPFVRRTACNHLSSP